MSDVLKFIASLKITLIGLFLLAVGIVFILQQWQNPTIAILPGFIVLLINLGIAILVKEKIRNNSPLLFFHLSLLCLMLLILSSRLTYLKGWVELDEGEVFSSLTGILHSGPMHPDDFSQVAFKQLHFTTRIEEGTRKETQSVIGLPISRKEFLLSDQTPLTLANYQFTLSSHIGYSILLSWQGEHGFQLGSIKLPPYQRDRMLAREWILPGTELKVWIMLDMDNSRSMAGDFALPEDYQLVLRYEQQRYQIKPGESHCLAQGCLTFRGLKRWIGYDVFYDWAIPWLIVTCLSAILSLGVFLWQKSSQSDWDSG